RLRKHLAPHARQFRRLAARAFAEQRPEHEFVRTRFRRRTLRGRLRWRRGSKSVTVVIAGGLLTIPVRGDPGTRAAPRSHESRYRSVRRPRHRGSRPCATMQAATARAPRSLPKKTRRSRPRGRRYRPAGRVRAYTSAAL